MAAVAVLSGRFLTTPVAIETRGVIVGRRFESIRPWCEAVSPTAGGCNKRFRIGDVADLAVVVFLRFVIEDVRGPHKGNADRPTKVWL